MAKGKKGGLVRIIFSILAIVSGISICATFAPFRNYHAAIWGLLSAIFAYLVLRLHIAYRKNKLHVRFTPESLLHMQYLGGVATFITIVFSITYFTLAVVYKQGYQMKDAGFMPAGIFSFLALKGTISLIFFSRKYRKFLLTDMETATIARSNEPSP